MERVKIYRFRTYKIQTDEFKESRRWGTREAIRDKVRGEVIEDSEVEVDSRDVESDILGLTVVGYTPHPIPMLEPLFAEYEDAVDAFLHAGGHTPSLILSPSRALRQFRDRYPDLATYTNGVPIEEAPQNYVSVRGTTIAGQEFDWPDPE
jgi:hypothetical protein